MIATSKTYGANISFFRIEFSALAVAHKAVNVGQGFIDYEPPHYLIDFYKEAVNDPNILLHQYTRGYVNISFPIQYRSLFQMKMIDLSD